MRKKTPNKTTKNRRLAGTSYLMSKKFFGLLIFLDVLASVSLQEYIVSPPMLERVRCVTSQTLC